MFSLSWKKLEVSGQLHSPAALPPGERISDTHWIVGWVDPRASLSEMEKLKFFTLLGLELRPLRDPDRNQSLYRIRYSRPYTSWWLHESTYTYYVLHDKSCDILCIICWSSWLFLSWAAWIIISRNAFQIYLGKYQVDRKDWSYSSVKVYCPMQQIRKAKYAVEFRKYN
jgi:hypothetical protein